MHTIVTNNQYLRIAIDSIQSKYMYRETCIIDLTSMKSLTEIMTSIQRNKRFTRFIFLGNTCVYSRLMLPYLDIKLTMPMNKIHEKLKNSTGMSYGAAMSRLVEYKDMENMTHKDKITVHSLLLNDSIIRAARYAAICPKTFYHRVNGLAGKMNLTTLQAHYFVRKEYLPNYVRRKLIEHALVSLCKEFRK